MQTLSSLVKDSLLVGSITLALSGCALVGMAVGPATGANDGAQVAGRIHPLLTLPGAAVGAAAGPVVGFVQGMRNDLYFLEHGTYDTGDSESETRAYLGDRLLLLQRPDYYSRIARPYSNAIISSLK